MRVPREVWWIAGACLVALGAGLLLRSSRQAAKERVIPTATSYSSDPYGLRALYLTLGELGYEPQRSRTPLVAAALRGRGTLLVVNPFPVPLSSREWEDLYAWVARGNTLVLAGWGWPEFLEQFPLQGIEDKEKEPVAYAHPTQPSYLCQGVGAMAVHSNERLKLGERQRPPPQRQRDEEKEGPGWPLGAAPERATKMDDAIARAVPVIGDGNGAVVSYALVGAGRVVTLAEAWPLSNAGIGRADNLRFVLNAIGPAGAPVLFDEYHHGYQDQLAWRLLPLAAKLGLAQIVLGLLVVAYARGKRLGPVVPLDRGSRQRTEFLQTMTVALQRGHATHLALRAAYAAALDQLYARTGMLPGADADTLTRAASPDRKDAADRLAAALEAVRGAAEGDGALSEPRAMSLVRRLDKAMAAGRGI